MLVENRYESVTVTWFQQMHHFVNDDIFQESLRLLHELRIESDVTCLGIAASPLGLHPLQKIPGDLHLRLLLPLADEPGHNLVQQGLVPIVDDLGALRLVAARSHGQRQSFVVAGNKGSGIPLDDCQEMPRR